jgi:hypothetical protein
MHWDGTISLGNVMSIVIILSGVIIAMFKLISRYDKSILLLTVAVDSLKEAISSIKLAISNQQTKIGTIEIATEVTKQLREEHHRQLQDSRGVITHVNP